MPAFLHSLMPLICIVLGVYLAAVGVSRSVRHNFLTFFRGTQGWSHETEQLVCWFAFIVGSGLISMVVPYTISMAIFVGLLLYQVKFGR
jgi:hypothetical protein